MLGKGAVLRVGVAHATSGIGRTRRELERRALAPALLLTVLGAGNTSAFPSIDALSVRPAYFTPNGDGRTDTTQVSFVPGGAGATVGARVDVRRVADEALIATPLPLGAVLPGVPVEQSWDPGPIADGEYRFEVLVVDGADSVTASAIVVADTTAPIVSFGAVGPNPFDPLLPPPDDLLRVPFQVVSDSGTATSIAILNPAGATVDTLGSFAGSGSGEFTWDGRNSGGSLVPTGSYDVRALARDLAGNADTTRQVITVDRDPPLLGGVADSLQTDTVPIVLQGSAADFDLVVSVEIKVDDGDWTPVDEISPSGPYRTWSTTPPIPDSPGIYDVRIRARDALGHTSEHVVVVAFDRVIPQPVSTTVIGGGTVRDGDMLRVQTVWNLPGLDVSMDLSPLDFDWTAGEETVIEGPPASYLIEYRVSPSNIRRGETKQLVITASTGIVTGKDSVFVTLVDSGPREGELIAVSRNRFDPEARETVTIATERSAESVRVQIINVAGDVVRELEGSGWVEWDGRSASGGICGSGVYFLRVKAGNGEEIRRVAVLRGGSR